MAQVFGGAGSPGGRVDSWTDPRLLALDPIYATMLKVYPQGAGSIRWPANNRRVDLIKAMDENLTPLLQGPDQSQRRHLQGRRRRQRRLEPVGGRTRDRIRTGAPGKGPRAGRW